MFLAIVATQPAFYWIFWIGLVILGLATLYFTYDMYRATHSSGWFFFLLTTMAGAFTIILGMTLSDNHSQRYKDLFMILFATAAVFEAIMLPRAFFRLSKDVEAELIRPRKVIITISIIGILILIYNIIFTKPFTTAIIATITIYLLGISRLISLPFLSNIRKKEQKLSWSLLYLSFLTTSISLIVLAYLGGCCALNGPINTYATCSSVTGDIAMSIPQFCPAPIPQLYIPFLWILFVGQFVETLALYIFWTNLGDDLL